jgi:hypothetical protein
MITSQDVNNTINQLSGVMVSVLALNPVDHVFDPRSASTKYFCFYASHAALRDKSGIGRMCWNGATCLYMESAFRELGL